MGKTNKAVGEKNYLDKSWDSKRLVHYFTNNEFCKYIGCFLSAVTYGKKLHRLWG